MSVPFLCLSSHCEITDTSENLLSLPADLRGKDFLLELIGENNMEALEEFCILDEIIPPMTVALPKRRFGYSTAVAVKCSSGNTYLYLLQDQSDSLSHPSALKDSNTDSHISKKLFIGDTVTDIPSFLKVCSRLVSKLSFSSLPSNVVINTDFSSASNVKLASSYYASLLDIISALVSVLGSTTEEEIRLSAASHGTSLELSVSGTTGIIPPFTGLSHDIMVLAPYLRGSLQFLHRALLSADSIGFKLSAAFSPNGTLTFTISNTYAVMSVAEFKLPTENEEEAAIFEFVSTLLLSVKKQKDQ